MLRTLPGRTLVEMEAFLCLRPVLRSPEEFLVVFLEKLEFVSLPELDEKFSPPEELSLEVFVWRNSGQLIACTQSDTISSGTLRGFAFVSSSSESVDCGVCFPLLSLLSELATAAPCEQPDASACDTRWSDGSSLTSSSDSLRSDSVSLEPTPYK